MKSLTSTENHSINFQLIENAIFLKMLVYVWSIRVCAHSKDFSVDVRLFHIKGKYQKNNSSLFSDFSWPSNFSACVPSQRAPYGFFKRPHVAEAKSSRKCAGNVPMMPEMDKARQSVFKSGIICPKRMQCRRERRLQS